MPIVLMQQFFNCYAYPIGEHLICQRVPEKGYSRFIASSILCESLSYLTNLKRGMLLTPPTERG